MNPSFPTRVALIAAVLACAGAANATSTATSTFGDFHIGLTDLDPSDGVAPSVSLDPQSRSQATASAGAGFIDPVVEWTAQGDSAFGAVASAGDLAGTGGSASFAGDPMGAGAVISASAHGGPSLDVGSASALVVTPSFYNLLVLSPHTEVTLGGNVTLDWSASNPAAAAHGEVDLDFYTLDSGGEDVVSQQYATAGYYGGGDGALSGSTSSALFATYDNASDAPAVLGYYVAAFASASELETVPPPVDEPAVAVLLLAGVALLQRVMRRRR